MSSAAPLQKARQRTGKYLTFQIDDEEFGVLVLRIREIMGIQAITSVPHTPTHVKGVINLRGKVIPVIDMRLKLGLERRDYDRRTCIIVASVQTGADAVLMGIVVDGVSEVVTISEEQIEDPPKFGGGVQVRYLLGMAKTSGKVKLLLDIDEALSAEDLSQLRKIIEQHKDEQN
ncbi:MAG: purine-binding chemotaxis protein CheW [Bryobacterales bacterium]|nr:purine-binding chemotaxis protein CheW [Bryobacterales bacterium]